MPGEPAQRLSNEAEYFLANTDNPGYGRAVNRLLSCLISIPPFLGILNTDLTWMPNTFETILEWLSFNNDVNLLVPTITSTHGEVQKLCKRNPTVLAMFSRRFIPAWLKPDWLCRYDEWYTMSEYDYNKIFDVPYLSGCCMVVKSSSFISCGGFDNRFFLYLEDADLTRTLSMNGRCIHFPYSSVTHEWGRGNYRNLWLMLVNLISTYKYFAKWGLKIW